jgi:hypothetical protein
MSYSRVQGEESYGKSATSYVRIDFTRGGLTCSSLQLQLLLNKGNSLLTTATA